MFVYLKICPREIKPQFFIYPISSTGGKQSSSTMSNGEGVVQTNQPLSMKEKEKKSESYEQPINNDGRKCVFCACFLFFSPMEEDQKGKSVDITHKCRIAPAQSARCYTPPERFLLRTKASSWIDCFGSRDWLPDNF